jgi:hypothetical protein
MHTKLRYVHVHSQAIDWHSVYTRVNGPSMYMPRLLCIDQIASDCITSHRITSHHITSHHITSRNAPCGAKVNNDQLLLRSCLEKNRFHFFESLGLEHLSASHAQERWKLLGDTEQRRCRRLGLPGWASTGGSSHGCSGSLCRSSGWHDGQEKRHQAAES